jgi:hypothetical protein
MKPRSVQEIVADATRRMLMGTFRDPKHLPRCICIYCENAAARLLFDYERDVTDARAIRDKGKLRNNRQLKVKKSV